MLDVPSMEGLATWLGSETGTRMSMLNAATRLIAGVFLGARKVRLNCLVEGRSTLISFESTAGSADVLAVVGEG